MEAPPAPAPAPAPSSSSKKRKQCHKYRQRWNELTNNAAERTLRGDGCNPFLPALPTHGSIHLQQLQRRHPYGVLPYGNKLTSMERDCKYSLSVENFRRLNEEQCMCIAGYWDGRELAQMGQTCRYWYVLTHVPELWRDLMLRRETPMTFFHHCWRDTYVQTILQQQQQQQQTTHSKKEQCDTETYESEMPDRFRHKPLAVKGCFSDYLYRSYLCSTFRVTPDLDKAPPSCQIARLDNQELLESNGNAIHHFLTTYEQQNQPCILTNVTHSWPASQKWKDSTYFLNTVSPTIHFRATSGAAPLPASFTLKAYFQYCSALASKEHLHEEAPLYLFDRTFDTKAPHLLHDYQASLHQSCPYFNPTSSYHHDLFHLLGPTERPDHRWIIMGPANHPSGSAFHIDPNATHAWNFPVTQSKYWIFYPPGVSPPGIHPSPNGDDVAMPISLGEWFLTYWDEHVKQRCHPDEMKRPMEGIVRPGEILFVPHGWWHLVLNLGSDDDTTTTHNDDTLSIAVTQNYVSARNVSDVLRFLKTRQQQISGCRDRPEAVSPEELYHVFAEKLKVYDEALWKTAYKDSERTWMCHAWNDVETKQDTITTTTTTTVTIQRTKMKKLSVLERAKLPSSLVREAFANPQEEETNDCFAKTHEDGNEKFTFSFL